MPGLVTVIGPNGIPTQVAATPGNSGITNIYGQQGAAAPTNTYPAMDPAPSTPDYPVIDSGAQPATVADAAPPSSSPTPDSSSTPADAAAPVNPATGTAWPDQGGGNGVTARASGTGTGGGAAIGAPAFTPMMTKAGTSSSAAGKGAIDATQDAYVATQKAIEAQANATAEQKKTEAARYSETQRLLQKANDDAANQREITQQNIQTRLKDIDAATSKLEGMSVDPSRAFGEGVTASKVMAGIGIALGAIGSGMSGKDNQAIKIVQDAIAQDVEAQKANMMKQGEVVKLKRGGLETYLAVTKDMDQAKNLETARQMQIVAAKYDAIAASTSDPQIKADALKQSAFFKDQVMQARSASDRTTTKEVETGSMKPLQTDLPAEHTKEIVENEGLAKRYGDVYNQMADAQKKGKAQTGVGKSLNGTLRMVGLDDTQTTALDAKLRQLSMDSAGDDKMKREAALKNYENMAGTVKDKPETIMALLAQERDTRAQKAADLRKALDSGYHRMPNQPDGFQQAVHPNGSDLGAKFK